MAQRLTELAIQKAKPPQTGQVEIWDGTVPGLGLRISAAGTRSWILMYRIGGRARRLTLGRWPETRLQAARERAQELRKLAREGRDPAFIRAEAARDANRDLFEHVVTDFIEKRSTPSRRTARGGRPSGCCNASW
jgi:hypothetical protein